MPNDSRRAIMAIGAHADDLELQVGGTLAKYHDDYGYEIVYVMSTDNISGGWMRLQEDGTYASTAPPYTVMQPQRLREAEAGAAALGTRPIHLNYPQRHYTGEDEVRHELRYGCARPEGIPEDVPTILTACENEAAIARVKNLILEHQPEAVLTHGMPMTNPEHFCTSVLVLKAYRAAVEQGFDGMLLLWKDLGVWTYGEAYSQWDTFVDITRFMKRKLELSALHASQKPNPERLDWPQWGAACGCGHAEVFTIAGRSRCPKDYQPLTMEILQNARR